MTLEEQHQIIRRYDERLAAHGESAQTLGWRDAAQQQLRFGVLLGVGDCSESEVLDIGCGFGDLCGYFEARGVRGVRYSGTDLNPTLISAAQRRHPAGNFHATTDLTRFADGSMDYVFMSGLFNFRLADNAAFMRDIVREAFRIARRGVAFNLLGSHVDFREPHLCYYHEGEVFAFSKSLTRFVTLRADYPLYEFTVYLHREGKADR